MRSKRRESLLLTSRRPSRRPTPDSPVRAAPAVPHGAPRRPVAEPRPGPHAWHRLAPHAWPRRPGVVPPAAPAASPRSAAGGAPRPARAAALRDARPPARGAMLLAPLGLLLASHLLAARVGPLLRLLLLGFFDRRIGLRLLDRHLDVRQHRQRLLHRWRRGRRRRRLGRCRRGWRRRGRRWWRRRLGRDRLRWRRWGHHRLRRVRRDRRRSLGWRRVEWHRWRRRLLLLSGRRRDLRRREVDLHRVLRIDVRLAGLAVHQEVEAREVDREHHQTGDDPQRDVAARRLAVVLEGRVAQSNLLFYAGVTASKCRRAAAQRRVHPAGGAMSCLPASSPTSPILR